MGSDPAEEKEEEEVQSVNEGKTKKGSPGLPSIKFRAMEAEDGAEEIPETKPEPAATVEETIDETPDFLKNIGSPDSPIRSKIKARGRAKPEDSLKTSEKESDDLFGSLDEESVEDILSDFKNVFAEESGGDKPVISAPIIEILKKQGYIKGGEISTEEGLQKVPEYSVLKLIIMEHPIPLNEMEEKTEVESLSLVLSNLQADNLIEYTNDYQWTISNQVRETLIEFISKTKEVSGSDSAKLRGLLEKKTKYERQFIYGMYKLGIVMSLELSLFEMNDIDEFSILQMIKDNEPISFERIQDVVSETPPVQTKRLLAKMEGEDQIRQTNDGKWELSDRVVSIIVGIMDED